MLYGLPRELRIIAREGDLLPQFGPGVFHEGFFGPYMAQAGQTGYSAYLDGPGINAGNDHTVWAGPPGQIGLVAREGNPTPDAGGGVVYGGAFIAALGRERHVAFKSGLVHPLYELPDQMGRWGGCA